MTQEEKARAYDKALKRAKSLIGDTIIEESGQHIAEVIFPELKESEDKRIREEIIEYLERTIPHHHRDEVLKSKEWTAWLEKQGEQIDIANKEYWRGYREGKQEIIDKYSNLEKQGDQTPSDKVEPKFKVGDWVVVDDGRTGRIIECTKDFADVDLEFSCLSTRVNNIRSWTIQDAKDGNVLAFKNNIGGIIICKSPTDYDTRSYCRLIGDNFINKEESGWDSTLLIPATKEQRDALIKAMADAGYEWDVEKKELKKIENKNHLLSDFFKAEYERGKADVLKSIAWSEEDEEMLRSIIATCELAEQDRDSSPARHLLEMQLNWLKSLKERYTWKPSEEQMDALEQFISEYKDIDDNFRAYPISHNIESLYNDLKKLREE